ncbi:hypothetical protein, partial [Cutibacterium avidum]
SAGATKPGDNTPRIIHETGAASHAGPGDRDPSLRGHQQGNGANLPGDVIGCTNGQESVDIRARFGGRCTG